jgi:hypothetical protein
MIPPPLKRKINGRTVTLFQQVYTVHIVVDDIILSTPQRHMVVEVQLYSFLILVLDECGESTLHSECHTPRESDLGTYLRG